MASFDLSAYSGSQIKIRFQTLGAGSSRGVGIDDISITGTAGTPTPPSITVGTVTPNPVTAGSNLTIPYTTTGTFNTGNTFTAVLSDATGTTFATPLTMVSSTATSLTVTIPASTPAGTTYQVRVDGSNPATTGTPSGNFAIVAPAPAPTISGFTPPNGPVGTAVTITGTGFSGATSVAFNGVAATFTIQNSTTLSATVPAGASTGPVSVTTPSGIATSSTNFTVDPKLTVSVSALSGFSYTVGAGPSSAQSYTLTGFNLAGNPVTVTAPSNYEVSQNNTTFSSSLTFTSLTTTTIYVRLKAGLAVGSYNNALVVNEGGGAANVEVTLSGSVTAAPAATKWDGGGDGSSFADALNWDNDVVPSTGGDILLDHTFVAGAYTVTLPSVSTGTLSLGSLVINPGAGAAITVVLPSTNTAIDYLRFTKTTNALVIYDKGTFISSSGSGSGSTAVDVVPSGANFIIYNGGRFVHNNIRSVSDLVDNLATTLPGTETGIFQYDVPSGSSYNIPAAGRTYGTLIFGGSSGGTPLYQTSGGGGTSSDLIIRGNLEVAVGKELRIIQNSDVRIAGNATVLGTFKFAPASLLTRRRLILNGAALQTFTAPDLTRSNTGTSFLGLNVVLQINNTGAGVLLNTNVAVNSTGSAATAGGLELTNGIVTLASGKRLLLTDGATITGGSATSFVSGSLAYESAAPATLTFPIGKAGAYRPLTLAVAAQASGAITYTAEQQEGRPTDQTMNPAVGTVPMLQRVSRARYYSVLSSDPTSFSGTLTLSYGSDDGVTDANAASLVVGRNATGTSGWDNAGRTSFSSSTLVSANLTQLGTFALASTDAEASVNPLPVTLTRFVAERQPEGVQLRWTTAAEHNNAYFEVQRAASDKQFRTIARLEGQGQSTRTQDYAALDRQPLPGLSYYRLRQVDNDGKASLSPVVAIAASTGLSLYPNPTAGRICIRPSLPQTGAALQVRVRDLAGRILQSQLLPDSGEIDLAALPAGFYLVTLGEGPAQVTCRVVKN